MKKIFENRFFAAVLFVATIVLGIWLSVIALPITDPVIHWFGGKTGWVLDQIKAIPAEGFLTTLGVTILALIWMLISLCILVLVFFGIRYINVLLK